MTSIENSSGRAQASPDLISIQKVSKVYRTGAGEFAALRDVSVSIGAGEFVAVVGTSGSGKSTLLNMVARIDEPTSGSVVVDGVVVSGPDEHEAARRRRTPGTSGAARRSMPSIQPQRKGCDVRPYNRAP